MHGVHTIWQDPFESSEVHRIGIAVEEENVVGAHLSNGFLDLFVESTKIGMIWVRRLIERVVPDNLQQILARQ